MLSQEYVENAVKILVTRFIPLNPSDLEGWMADPEEWVNTEEKENDQWEYELRVSMPPLSPTPTHIDMQTAVRRAGTHGACGSVPPVCPTSHRNDFQQFGGCVAIGYFLVGWY